MNELSKQKRQSEMVGKERTSYPPKGYGVFLQSDRVFYLLVLGLILHRKLIIIRSNYGNIK